VFLLLPATAEAKQAAEDRSAAYRRGTLPVMRALARPASLEANLVGEIPGNANACLHLRAATLSSWGNPGALG
jgi:hypothetical protein